MIKLIGLGFPTKTHCDQTDWGTLQLPMRCLCPSWLLWQQIPWPCTSSGLFYWSCGRVLVTGQQNLPVVVKKHGFHHANMQRGRGGVESMRSVWSRRVFPVVFTGGDGSNHQPFLIFHGEGLEGPRVQSFPTDFWKMIKALESTSQDVFETAFGG